MCKKLWLIAIFALVSSQAQAVTNFPAILDTNAELGVAITGTPVPSIQTNNKKDAILAIEAKVGVDGSAVATSLEYLLKNPLSIDPGHEHTSASLPATTAFIDAIQTWTAAQTFSADIDISSINSVPYAFPGVQGAVDTYLKNDGSGNLSWAASALPANVAYLDVIQTWTAVQSFQANIGKINNVSYVFPAVQGAVSTVLKNDGSGNLAWSTIASLLPANVAYLDVIQTWTAVQSFQANISKINNVVYVFPAIQGAASTYLKNDGAGNLSWATSSTAPGDISGAVQFNNAGAFGGDAANFFWNNTTKRLGIGTAALSASLHIVNDGTFDAIRVVASGAEAKIRVTDSNTAGFASASFLNDTGGNILLTSYGSTYAGTRYGLALANLRLLEGTGGPVVLGTSNSNPLVFGINQLEVGRFDTTGYFGIGTISPSEIVDIAKAGDHYTVLRQLTGPVQNGGAAIRFVQGMGTPTANNIIADIRGVIQEVGPPIQGTLQFLVNTGGSLATKMQLTSTGTLIVNRVTSPPSFSSNSRLIVNDTIEALGNGTDANLKATSYGATPQVLGRNTNGTEAAPTSIAGAGEEIFQIRAEGFHLDGTPGFNNAASIRFFSKEAFTTTDGGGYIEFWTTPENTIIPVRKMVVDVDTRIEGDTLPNLFFLDSSVDRIFITDAPTGGTPPTDPTGGFSAGTLLALVNNSAGGDNAILSLMADNATGTSEVDFADADAPYAGYISYTHVDDRMFFGVNSASAVLVLTTTGVVVNDSGAATNDFRVEGDTQTNLLFVDSSDDRASVSKEGNSLTIDGTLIVKTSTTTVTNTSSQADLTTKTLAGAPSLARVYHIFTGGDVKNDASDTIQYRVSFGGTVVCDTGAMATSTIAKAYVFDAHVTVRVAGATATVQCDGTFHVDAVVGVGGTFPVHATTGSVDLSGTPILKTTVQFAGASAPTANDEINETSAVIQVLN